MVKKLMAPYAAPKRGLPCEMKYDYAMGGYLGLLKAFLYAIREKYGANAALKVYERTSIMDDREKRFTNKLLKIFKIEGNDAEAVGAWWDIYQELTGIDGIIVEQSKKIDLRKITKCPFKTDPKDISDRCIIFCNLVTKSINSNATYKRPKALCAGDPYCEFITRIEE